MICSFDVDGQHYQDGCTAQNMRSVLTYAALFLFMLHFTVISLHFHSIFSPFYSVIFLLFHVGICALLLQYLACNYRN